MVATIVKVRIGEHDSNRQDETFLETKDLELKNFIVHEEYKHNSKLRHDIALLELEEEVDLSVYTPVCLPSSVRNRDNTPALAIGKGRFYLILFTLWNCAKLNLLVYGISTTLYDSNSVVNDSKVLSVLKKITLFIEVRPQIRLNKNLP